MFTFLFSSVTKILLTIGLGSAVVAGTYIYGYVKGGASCAAKFQVAEVKAELAAVKHEAEAYKKVVAEQEKQTREAAERAAKLAERAKALEALVDERTENCPKASTEDEMRAIRELQK